MIIWPDMEQRSEAWFKARAGRPTASQFSRLLTPTGKDSSQWDDLAIELTVQCLRPDEIPSFIGNRHTDRGNELEPEARELFSEIMDLETREVGFITRDDEVAGCSPDSLISRPGVSWETNMKFDARGYLINGADLSIAGLEIKCPEGKKHGRILVDDDMPAEYVPQVHGSMAVTGLRFWYFMSYCPGLDPFIKRVEWNSYTDKMSDAIDRFIIYYAARRKQILPILKRGERAA